MGLFSFKKKPKEEKPAAPAAAKALPSLGLPENKPNPAAKPTATPGAASPETIATLVAASTAPMPQPVAESVPLSTKLAAENTAEPEVYTLPEVTLEETGFIQAPEAGTGSVSLEVGLPDPDLSKPAPIPTPTPTPAPVAAAPAAAAPATIESPSISLTAPTPEPAPAISLAAPDIAQPAISIAAPVTSIAEPGTPSGIVAPGATPTPEFKPPNVAAAPSPAATAAPAPEGLKSQVLPARAFRVVISTLHRLKFRPAEPVLRGKEEAQLSNISTSGVGLVATDFIRPPAMKSVIGGHLVFDSGSHPVQLEVMHVTSGVIGCKFGGEKVDGLREAIKTYFELELLALGMLKVNPAHHKAEADGNAHWIHGDQCELFYVTDAANKLVRFRLTFLGNRFVWTKAGGLNLGQVIDDRVGIMRTDRIAVMEATPEINELALRFLHNIPQVPQEHRDQIGNAISPGYVLKPEPKKAA